MFSKLKQKIKELFKVRDIQGYKYELLRQHALNLQNMAIKTIPIECDFKIKNHFGKYEPGVKAYMNYKSKWDVRLDLKVSDNE